MIISLLLAARRKKIVTILAEQGTMAVSELGAALGVSDATVRRDLRYLETHDLIKRTWGGAAMRGHLDVSPEWLYDSGPHSDLTARIGKEAARLVQPGQCISIQTGSTVFAIARNLISIPRLRVITNSLPIAQLLKVHGRNTDVILVGGSLSGKGYLFGPLANMMIEQFTVDLTFVGVQGASLDNGISTDDPIAAELKRAFMRSARHTVVVADHHKLGNNAHVRVDGWSAVHTMITTKEADHAFLQTLRDAGVTVRTA